MNNPIGWFEIYVSNISRAQKFYEQVFDVKLTPLEVADTQAQMLVFPMNQDKYGSCGALIHMDGYPVGANSVIIYFSCDDCALEAKKVVQCGGSIQQEKTSIGEHGFFVLAIDTEGNTIGLHSMK